MTIIITDLETTGLHLRSDDILEVAAAAVSDNLMLIYGVFHRVIKWSPTMIESMYERSDPFVQEMHSKNGLWDECKSEEVGATSLVDDLTEMHDWCQSMYSTTSPAHQLYLMGDSVWFDYEFLHRDLPKFDQYFYHRFIDLSAVSQMFHLWDVSLASRFDFRYPEEKAEEIHRAIPDVIETYQKAFKTRAFLRTINPYMPWFSAGEQFQLDQLAKEFEVS